MRKVRVYQTSNRDYVFMSWEWSQKYFNFNDYKLVAEFDNDYDDLEGIFQLGNNGKLKSQGFKMRSISVSDIIEIDGVKYFVNDIGFVEL